MRFGKDTYRDTVWSYRFTPESSLVSVKVNDNCQRRSGECVGHMKITRLVYSLGDERLFHARRIITTNYLSIRSESRDNLPPAIKESIQFVFIQALQGFVTFKCQSCCLNQCLPKRRRASE